jgi:hypothetical protein
LVTSIRWELLREGMEDYEYLWLVNGGDPEIGVANDADALTDGLIGSRTAFSRVPTDIYETRALLAAQLTGPSASKSASGSTIGVGETFDYVLAYDAGDAAHTLTLTDEVPAATTVVTATGSIAPMPSVDGQIVAWTVDVDRGQTVTLTITARGIDAGRVTNTATFSGTQVLEASSQILVYQSQVFLPLVLRGPQAR